MPRTMYQMIPLGSIDYLRYLRSWKGRPLLSLCCIALLRHSQWKHQYHLNVLDILDPAILQRTPWVRLAYARSNSKMNNFWLYKESVLNSILCVTGWRSQWHHLLHLSQRQPQWTMAYCKSTANATEHDMLVSTSYETPRRETSMQDACYYHPKLRYTVDRFKY